MIYNQSTLADLSFLELIGAIFVRAQLIEQIMRELTLRKDGYEPPDDFERKTYGQLLAIFVSLYPEIKDNNVPPDYKEHIDMSLHASLKNANDVRNSAAHGDYLAHVSTKDLMPAKDGDGVDRLTMKSARKSAMAMDTALIELWNYRAKLLKQK